MSRTGSRNIGRGAISKVESAQVVLAPKWQGVLRGESGFVNPIT